MREVWVVYYQDYDDYQDIAAYSTEEAANKKVKRLGLKHNWTNEYGHFPKSYNLVVSMKLQPLRNRVHQAFRRHVFQLYGHRFNGLGFQVKKLEVLGA